MCEYSGEDIFEELASVRDPEKLHLTLADLNVVAADRCFVTYLSSSQPTATGATTLDDAVLRSTATSTGGLWAVARRRKPTALVTVVIRPTVPHCHLINLICLSVAARLYETLPVTTVWKIRITLVPGSHHHIDEVERQAADKERTAAALENPHVARELKKLINPYD